MVNLDACNVVDRDVIVVDFPERHTIHADRHNAGVALDESRREAALHAAHHDALVGEQGADRRGTRLVDLLAREEMRESAIAPQPLVEARQVAPIVRMLDLDRKSTRLNSSH